MEEEDGKGAKFRRGKGFWVHFWPFPLLLLLLFLLISPFLPTASPPPPPPPLASHGWSGEGRKFNKVWRHFLTYLGSYRVSKLFLHRNWVSDTNTLRIWQTEYDPNIFSKRTKVKCVSLLEKTHFFFIKKANPEFKKPFQACRVRLSAALERMCEKFNDVSSANF